MGENKQLSYERNGQPTSKMGGFCCPEVSKLIVYFIYLYEYEIHYNRITKKVSQ
jgi:hypothetical protein